MEIVLSIIGLSGLIIYLMLRYIYKNQPEYYIAKEKLLTDDIFVIYKKRSGITYLPEDWYYSLDEAEREIKILETSNNNKNK